MDASTRLGRLPRMLGAALFISAASVAYLPAASASTYYKFYTGGAGYDGAYSGAGTVYDATKGLSTLCPLLTPCSSDVFGNPLDFGSVSASATAGNGTGGQRVWDDSAPKWGGLGVDSISIPGPGEDQISGNEVLTLTFDDKVRLTGLATLFTDAHEGFGSNYATKEDVIADAGDIEFKMKVDGGAWEYVNFYDANLFLISKIGKEFSFMQASDGPTFYVGAVAASAIPLPAAAWLFGSAVLGMLGFARRRKQSDVSAV